MKIRIKDILKNQQGSSLAFVLIIGMVIMIMVASLLAVANSDFTFTQETVESRQAYIDAKSVIEFGKIEIKIRESKLKELRDKVNDSKDEYELNANIAVLENTISNYKSNPAVIYGNADNVAETLSFQSGANELGKVMLEEEVGATNTGGTTSSQSINYIFKIETENLRRLLDYKIDFDYIKTTTTTTGTSGTLVTPIKPTAPPALARTEVEPNDNSSSWIAARFEQSYWPSPTPITICTIDSKPQIVKNSTADALSVDQKSLSIIIDKFGWVSTPKLDLDAKNVAFNIDKISSDNNHPVLDITANGTSSSSEISGELRFLKNVSLESQSTLLLKSKNTIFKGSLSVGNSAQIDISCEENLWFEKGLTIKTGNSSLMNKLKAKNIIIDGDFLVESFSGINIECDTLWIKGDFVINTNNKDILNRIKAKNIIVENVSNQKEGNITINGASEVTWDILENLWVEGNLNFSNWNPANNIENNISAQNIIINETTNKNNGGLHVSCYSKINLSCSGNLWVKSVDIETNDLSLVSNIRAAQIIIDGSKSKKDGAVIVGDNTYVVWDTINFWLNGDMTTQATSSKQEFKNINYFSAGNIKLDDDSVLSITGAANKRNHMVVGAIQPVNSNDIHLNISNFCSFTCAGLALNYDSSLVLDSSIIKINGAFNLDGLKTPIELTCEYFDCSGKTTINNLQGVMNFNQKNNELNLRFYGGYQQNNSTVNIKRADKVIFGNPGKNNDKNNSNGNNYGNDGDFTLTQDNSHKLELNVKADAIYFDTNTIKFPEYLTDNVIYNVADFIFSGKDSVTTPIFNIKVPVKGVNFDIGKEGNHTNVSGKTISDLSNTVTDYTPPTWPNPLNCPCTSGGSSTIITITNGLEEYYKEGL